MDSRPILSLCIPTWNRAKYLKIGLEKLRTQLLEISSSDVEVFISDNCSTDETEQIVKEYISCGMPISYNKNEENVGMDGNFLRCFKRSNGQFIWLMGDDDFLLDGTLSTIIELLKSNPTIGLLHLREITGKSSYKIFNDISDFLKELTFWSTFITGNIFNRNALTDIVMPERYMGTYLIITPFYLTAAMKNMTNIMYYDRVFDGGADSGSNGGYNYFKVFVQNYLDIWKEYTDKFTIDESVFKYIKKDIYLNFHQHFIHMLLIQKQNILEEGQPRNGRKGFFVKDGKEILKKYYGNESYALPYFMKWQIRCFLSVIKHKLFK